MLVLLGGFLAYRGVHEARLCARTNRVAQTITLAELEESGYGDNAHVLMTDHELDTWSLKIEGVSLHGSEPRDWEAAWVRARPRRGAETPVRREDDVARRPFVVWVRLVNAQTVADVRSAAGRKSLRGVVVEDAGALSTDRLASPSTDYGTIDFDRTLVLEVGREPPGWLGTILWLLGAAASFAGAGFLVFVRLQERPGSSDEGDAPAA